MSETALGRTNDPAGVPSRAERVTFYEDRAEVVRRATVTLARGVQTVSLGGLTLFVDDRSVQARVLDEKARVVAAKVARRFVVRGELGQDEIDRLEAEQRAAERRLAESSLAAERHHRSSQADAALVAAWRRSISQVPHRGNDPALGEWGRSFDALYAASLETKLAMVAAIHSRSDDGEAAQLAQRRVQQGRTTSPVCVAVAEVQLDSPEAREVTVEITYRTPCALWRPEHLARLVADPKIAGQGQLQLATFATVWQATGERWEDVEAFFSTARPARSATPPLLRDDLLKLRKKTEQERKQVTVDVREETVNVTGAAGSRAVDDMPGVDDGGAPLSFQASGKVSLASDAEPHRVEIGRAVLEAKITRVLLPERAAVAHFKASATLGRGAPLLAGPIRVARESGYVGRSKVDFVGPGEPFELGFGPDDGMRVRRTTSQTRDRTPAIGTQKIENTVTLFLSNLSDTARSVEITERIPVSEIEAVEIRLLEAGGFKLAAKDGFLKQEVSVEPRATRVLELKYEVRARSNVVLPF